MNKNINSTVLELVKKIEEDVCQQKIALDNFISKTELEQTKNSETLNAILELLRANPQAESVSMVNTQFQGNEIMFRPTVLKNGKPRYKVLSKIDITDALPFCITEPCESNEDVEVLYTTISKLVERKVDSLISHTLNGNPPPWSTLLTKFKELVIRSSHQRALQLNVDLSRCERNWCLHHLVKISYANKVTYIKKKALEAAKKALEEAEKASEK